MLYQLSYFSKLQGGLKNQKARQFFQERRAKNMNVQGRAVRRQPHRDHRKEISSSRSSRAEMVMILFMILFMPEGPDGCQTKNNTISNFFGVLQTENKQGQLVLVAGVEMMAYLVTAIRIGRIFEMIGELPAKAKTLDGRTDAPILCIVPEASPCEPVERDDRVIRQMLCCILLHQRQTVLDMTRNLIVENRQSHILSVLEDQCGPFEIVHVITH
jgi:hypothetical protein